MMMVVAIEVKVLTVYQGPCNYLHIETNIIYGNLDKNY